MKKDEKIETTEITEKRMNADKGKRLKTKMHIFPDASSVNSNWFTATGKKSERKGREHREEVAVSMSNLLLLKYSSVFSVVNF
jgi:hypothetical protein